MSRTAYVCNLWKSLRINVRCSDDRVRVAEFENGFFETDDEEIQAGIEKNAAFGSSIHWQDDPSEIRRKEEAEAQANQQAVAEADRQSELMTEAEREANEAAKAKERAENQERVAARIQLKDKAKGEVQNLKDKAREMLANTFGG